MKYESISNLLKEYFKEGTDVFLPHVSVDCVVLGYEHPNLKVLVRRLPGYDFWSLPGGYVRKDENMDDAAYRNLSLWGIDEVFLRQIKTFGDVTRMQENSNMEFNRIPSDNENIRWVTQRFVTTVYYGLVNLKETQQLEKGISSESKWQNVDTLDNMLIDHASIVDETRKLLTIELLNLPIASKLLPESFTLNELRGLFETILNRNIDRGTFRRKMLKLGLIKQIDQRKDVKGRPSYLFCFNKEAYQKFLAEETKFGF